MFYEPGSAHGHRRPEGGPEPTGRDHADSSGGPALEPSRRPVRAARFQGSTVPRRCPGDRDRGLQQRDRPRRHRQGIRLRGGDSGADAKSCRSGPEQRIAGGLRAAARTWQRGRRRRRARDRRDHPARIYLRVPRDFSCRDPGRAGRQTGVGGPGSLRSDSRPCLSGSRAPGGRAPGRPGGRGAPGDAILRSQSVRDGRREPDRCHRGRAPRFTACLRLGRARLPAGSTRAGPRCVSQ